MLPPFCFTNDLASATVGQGKIAHDGVEVLRSQECKGAFHIVGGGNGMTEVPEQASQDTACIAVVFDHQYLQGHKSGKTSRGTTASPATTIEITVPVGCFAGRK